METTLIATAALLGLAGAPHCTLMCGAACAAATRQRTLATRWSFFVARLVGYAAAGAAAAASVGALSQLGQLSPALRPLWALLHAAAFAWGLWLMLTARQPQWLQTLARQTGRAAVPVAANGWQRMRGPLQSAAAGGLWVAWPCGLLQSALVVAALANSAAGGAAVMGTFAAVTSLGLVGAPWLFVRLFERAVAGLARRGAAAAAVSWATRIAGALLVVASGWALGQGLWREGLAYCLP